MTITNLGTATLYEADGKTIASMYGVATSYHSDLIATDDWVPHIWFDQTYGLLVDVLAKTITLIQPSTLRQWRLNGILQ